MRIMSDYERTNNIVIKGMYNNNGHTRNIRHTNNANNN